jgi:pilus assembly protein Flp/PilA
MFSRVRKNRTSFGPRIVSRARRDDFQNFPIDHLPSLDQKESLMFRNLQHAVVDFLNREDGPTAVEYAVMLALIIVVCITAIQALGSNANKTFTSVSDTIGGTSS